MMKTTALIPCSLLFIPFALSAAHNGLEPKQETKIKVRVTDDLDREIVKREFRVLADLQGMDGVGAFDIHRPFTFGSLILRKP